MEVIPVARSSQSDYNKAMSSHTPNPQDQEIRAMLEKLKEAGITPQQILREQVTLRLDDGKITEDYMDSLLGPEEAAVSLGDFSLEIPEGRWQGEGYVALEHGQIYTVCLTNHGTRCCDVRLLIDGESCGVFRVDAGKSISLERPTDSDGRFTFYRLGTREASKAEVRRNAETGLITAIFYPEHPLPEPQPLRNPSPSPAGYPQVIPARSKSPDTDSPPDSVTALEAGGTGLSSQSRQKFYRVRTIRWDEDAAVTLHLRLVHLAGGKVSEDHRLQSPLPPPLTHPLTPTVKKPLDTTSRQVLAGMACMLEVVVFSAIFVSLGFKPGAIVYGLILVLVCAPTWRAITKKSSPPGALP